MIGLTNTAPKRKTKVLQTYKDFVIARAAPSYQLSPNDFDLLHVALGLSTEVLELLISKSKDNTEEELGDLLWYLVFGSSVLHLDCDQLYTIYNSSEYNPHDNSVSKVDLVSSIEAFVSRVKKKCIYNQDIAVHVEFLDVWNMFCIHCKACKITLHELITSNTEKLSKRYKTKFTQSESISRNDK